jgi:hypothetical protein
MQRGPRELKDLGELRELASEAEVPVQFPSSFSSHSSTLWELKELGRISTDVY